MGTAQSLYYQCCIHGFKGSCFPSLSSSNTLWQRHRLPLDALYLKEWRHHLALTMEKGS